MATKSSTGSLSHVCFHTKTINGVQWIDAYPDARSYVCPGGMKKYPDVKYTQVSTLPGPMNILACEEPFQRLDKN